MRSRTDMLRWIILASILLAVTGCGLRYKDVSESVNTAAIPQVSPDNAPVETNADGSRTLKVKGKIVCEKGIFTVPYVGLLWTICKLPYARSDSGDLVLLDTGLGGLARVTLDTVARRRWPANLGKPRFVFVKSLAVGDSTFENLVAGIEDGIWQFRLFGIPLYEVSGVALGTSALCVSIRGIRHAEPSGHVQYRAIVYAVPFAVMAKTRLGVRRTSLTMDFDTRQRSTVESPRRFRRRPAPDSEPGSMDPAAGARADNIPPKA